MIDPSAIAPALAPIGIVVTGEPMQVASGWESRIFRVDTAGPTLAVRVFADPDPARAASEAEVIGAVRAAGYPVPAVHGLVSVDDHPAILLDFIDGRALWDDDSPFPADQVDELCRRLMDRLHGIEVDPSPDPLGWLREGSRRAVEQHPVFEPYVVTLWQHEPDDARSAWCHLDMHPGNVLWDGSPWVVDWTSARVTDPRLDLGWSRLLAEMYEPASARHFESTDGSEWWDAVCGLRRLVIVASMLAGDAHAADDLDEHLPRMRVPADWIERGTGIPIPDVGSLLGAPT